MILLYGNTSNEKVHHAQGTRKICTSILLIHARVSNSVDTRRVKNNDRE